MYPVVRQLYDHLLQHALLPQVDALVKLSDKAPQRYRWT
jgi:hypothetical protein